MLGAWEYAMALHKEERRRRQFLGEDGRLQPEDGRLVNNSNRLVIEEQGSKSYTCTRPIPEHGNKANQSKNVALRRRQALADSEHKGSCK